MSDVCSFRNCLALAVRDGQCAVHASGYRIHDGAGELRCDNCRHLILKDESYKRDGVSVRHTKNCRVHKDTEAEQAKQSASA